MALYPGPAVKPFGFAGSYSGRESIPYRSTIDWVSILPLSHFFPQALSLSSQPYGVGGGGKCWMREGSVADVFMVFAGLRIGVVRKAPLRFRREEVTRSAKHGGAS